MSNARFRERSRNTRNLESARAFKPRAYPVNRRGMIVNQGYGGHCSAPPFGNRYLQGYDSAFPKT